MRRMKIRWIGPSVEGAFHNNFQGVKRGQVLDTDGPDYLITEVSLRDYLANGLAEVVGESPKVEKAVVPEHKTETAKLDVDAPVPLDEDEPLSPSAVKRHKEEDAAVKESEESPHFPEKEFVDDLPEVKRPPIPKRRPGR
jgi:hypothetical protein